MEVGKSGEEEEGENRKGYRGRAINIGEKVEYKKDRECNRSEGEKKGGCRGKGEYGVEENKRGRCNTGRG